jgi:hypothetical protein
MLLNKSNVNLLTLCDNVMLEKLTVPMQVQKFPPVYRIWRLITKFTTACYLSLPSSNQGYTRPSYLLKSSIISHLCLGLPSSLFPSAFPTKTILIPCLFHNLWFDHLNNAGWWAQIINILIMQFYPVSCYCLPLRP